MRMFPLSVLIACLFVLLPATAHATPTPLVDITQVSLESMLESRSCALVNSGTIKCWGYNYYDELEGQNIIGVDSSATPLAISGISNATQIASGGAHSCALLTDQTIKCWGANYDGQLGNETNHKQSKIPIAISGISNAAQIALGSQHSCALLTDHTVKCWGSNSSGQRGSEYSYTQLKIPVTVSGIASATQIASGSNHLCALLIDQTIKCWGASFIGQLGNETILDSQSSVPVTVSGISNAAQIAFGSDHSCALLTDHTIKCWGANFSGQLGNETIIDNQSKIPVAVSGISNATQIALGSSHSCALLTDQTIKCWGKNEDGQLGNETTNSSTIPVTVSGISNAVQITLGKSHSCALLTDHTIKCWGDNRNRQLGNETIIDDFSTTPVIVVFNGDPKPPTTCPAPLIGTPPNCMTPILVMVSVPRAREVEVRGESRLGPLARTGVLRLRVPVPEKGTSVKLKLVVSAAQARKLGLTVPRAAKAITIGAASIKKTTRDERNISAKVKLTKAARHALRTHTMVPKIKTTLRLTYTKPGRKTRTLIKPLTLKR